MTLQEIIEQLQKESQRCEFDVNETMKYTKDDPKHALIHAFRAKESAMQIAHLIENLQSHLESLI